MLKSQIVMKSKIPRKKEKYQKGNKKDKRKVFKKNIYSREDSSSFDEDYESEND
jgi:hypothetical protein